MHDPSCNHSCFVQRVTTLTRSSKLKNHSVIKRNSYKCRRILYNTCTLPLCIVLHKIIINRKKLGLQGWRGMKIIKLKSQKSFIHFFQFKPHPKILFCSFSVTQHRVFKGSKAYLRKRVKANTQHISRSLFVFVLHSCLKYRLSSD